MCWYSSPGSGYGRVHVLGDAVGHDAAVRAVLGPLRDRVAQVLADNALEGLHLARLVQAAKQLSNERFSNITTTT